MSIIGNIRKLINPEPSLTPDSGNNQTYSQELQTPMPVSGGRSSVNNTQTGIMGSLMPTESSFPLDYLRVLSHLRLWNNHVSYAVHNFVSLANSRHSVAFPDNLPDLMKVEMMNHLKNKRDHWYELSESFMTLQREMFSQLALHGCISAEIEVSPDLSGIKKVHRVSPVDVRFAFDRKRDSYVPMQKVNVLAQDRPQVTGDRYTPGYVMLNPETYIYSAIERYDQEPYGIPPTLAALDKIADENDMLKSYKAMMKHMGLLGFLSVLVQAPQRKGGEGDDAYWDKCQDYLNKIYPQIEQGFSKGITVGFKNSYEFDITGNQMNANNADKLLEIMKKYIYSGLKQDPNMHGENYSVTETFGRVILAKLTQDMESFQNNMSAFWARIYLVELQLAGYPIDQLEVEFPKTMITDQKREQETEKMRIDNVIVKRDAGIITQDDAARELGYEEAAEEGNINTPVPSGDDVVDDDTITPDNTNPEGTDGGDSEESNQATTNLQKALRRNVTHYNQRFENSLSGYRNDIESLFDNYVDQKRETIKELVKQLTPDASSREAADILIVRLLQGFESGFLQPASEAIRENIEQMYDYYRRDDSIFSLSKPAPLKSPGFPDAVKPKPTHWYKYIKNNNNVTERRKLAENETPVTPEPTLSYPDIRALDYLIESDQHYMGKFLTKPEVKQRMVRFLDGVLESGETFLGKDADSVNQLTRQIQQQVRAERFQIRNVVETTANKVRNFGHVQYLQQAGIEKYQIVAVMDNKTSQHCQNLNGREFSVQVANDRINQLVQREPEAITEISPFATIYSPDEIKDMSNEALENAGISLPPFHGHCRTRIVRA